MQIYMVESVMNGMVIVILTEALGQVMDGHRVFILLMLIGFFQAIQIINGLKRIICSVGFDWFLRIDIGIIITLCPSYVKNTMYQYNQL